ncbi:glycosyltransferase family 2 protein [Acidiferrobacter sp. SPIII_3]|jgi:hypothetical protein|uniref:glycosyltransferase family 2 protein n=1 Tax=Acidiferrobacter sp. SPIII_3 TaxID=1281578 RepID=UPI00143DAACE|nr:glycosyltransferase family 2 protein [Acidiferrobacter sp. SPIII_3]
MTQEAHSDVRHAHAGGADTIAILLSTYNGEAYLADQLASLERQTYPYWRLIWRDDGSGDRTRAVMSEFSARLGKARCHELTGPSGRLGVLESYMALLRAARGYPFVAFADQDDVWLPGKLARAAHILQGIKDRPALYCGRQMLVDRDLRPLRESPAFRADLPFPAALAQNIATGCTILLNRPAADIIARSRPPKISLHDWWSYIVVSAHGGPVFFDKEPHILYRQHLGNAIGAPHIGTRIRRMLHKKPSQVLQAIDAHAQAIQDSVPTLPPETADKLKRLRASLRMPFMARLAFVLKLDLRRQSRTESVLMALRTTTARLP